METRSFNGLAVLVFGLGIGCGGEAERRPGVGGTSGVASTGSESESTDAEPSSGIAGSSSSTSSSDTTGPGPGPDTAETSSSSGDGSGSTSTGGNEGLGEIMGRCDVLDPAAFTSGEPAFLVNTLDFGDLGFDYDLLTPGGQEIFDDGNLGGSSLYSEVVAYEVLARCEMASLLKTEGEIVYDVEGARTDLIVDFDGIEIGVSVTRAQGFPLEDPWSVEQAMVLLEDKLGDIPLSTANVAPEDAWVKQILHVVAYGPMHAQSLQMAYGALGPELTLDTIVIVTVTEGEDLFIYTE